MNNKEEEEKELPGSVSYLEAATATVRFLRDPAGFVARGEDAFATHLLGRPTVIACSHASRLAVVSRPDLFRHAPGYAPLLERAYGRTALSEDSGPRLAAFRRVFARAASPEAVASYVPAARAVFEARAAEWASGPQPVPLYERLRDAFAEVSAALLLGAADDPAAVERAVRLGRVSYRGCTAAPVRVSLGRLYRSAFAAGQDANDELGRMFVERLRGRAAAGTFAGRCAAALRDEPAEGRDGLERFVAANAVMFLGGMVAKAFGSLAVCACAELARHPAEADDDGDEHLERVLLEVARMHPPAMGGCRGTADAPQRLPGGRAVPAGYAVWYCDHTAGRDPAAYERPDEFRPARWAGARPAGARPGFGHGERSCPGEPVAWAVLKALLAVLVGGYRWTLADPGDAGPDGPAYKVLPARRPKSGLPCVFKKK